MDDQQSNTSLVAGSKVSGTSVYNPSGQSIGSIWDIMIDKRSGKVAYAIMSFGGFMGIGEDYHPLPWSTLKYNTTLGGYVVDVSIEQLKNGPSYARDMDPGWGDPAYETKLHDFYGVGPYWGSMA